ncbi:hypothetical protein KAJ27_10845 [bacterium]|nr:hypothetical protein [bacterium]
MKKRALLILLLMMVFLMPVYSLKVVDTAPFSMKLIGPGIIEVGKGTAYRKIFLFKKNHIYDYKFNDLTYKVKFKKGCAFFKIKEEKEWSLWISNDSLTRQLNNQVVQPQIQNVPKSGESAKQAKNKVIQVTQSNQQSGKFSANLRNMNFSNLVNQPQNQSSFVSYRTSNSSVIPRKIVYRGRSIVGDIDNNGKVDQTDYVLLSSYLGTRVCNSTYDVNGDGKFNWDDIRDMKEVYLPKGGGNTGGGNTGGGNTGGGNTGGGNTGGGNTGGGTTGATCTEIYNQNGIIVQKCKDTYGVLSLKAVKGTEVVNLTYAENTAIVASFSDGTNFDINVSTGGSSCSVTKKNVATCTEIYNKNGVVVQKCIDTAGVTSLKVVKGTEELKLKYAENKTIVASFSDGTKYDIVLVTGGGSCAVNEQTIGNGNTWTDEFDCKKAVLKNPGLDESICDWKIVSDLKVTIDMKRGSIVLEQEATTMWKDKWKYVFPQDEANVAKRSGTAWIFYNENGKWYAETWEWMRPAQKFKFIAHIKSKLEAGGDIYFAVSGLARARSRNVKERTKIAKWK